MINDFNTQNTNSDLMNSSERVQNACPTELSLPSGWTFDERNPVGSVNSLTTLWSLEISFANCVTRIGAPSMADRPEAVRSYLEAEPLTLGDLSDEILLAAVEAGVKVNPRVLKAAISKIAREKRKLRKIELYARLTNNAASVDTIFTDNHFQRLAELFNMPRQIAIACIGHWIWQVKQKMMGRPVENHIMLIIHSKEQGTGKSTLVRKLVKPLAEFASADVLISDLADPRSREIFKYPVVVLDDMGRAAASDVSTIKAVVTGEALSRREMYTSNSATTRQAATFIGTANRPIQDLIDDDSGHRRFVMMPFKKNWTIVNELDFEKIWLSVNAFGPSPLRTHLAELRQFQSAFRPLPKVHQWILDLNLLSEELRSITVRGGVRAEALRDLYVAQTGDEISNQKFSDEMLKATRDVRLPFSGKQRKEVGALYMVRPTADVNTQRGAKRFKDRGDASALVLPGPNNLPGSSGEALDMPDTSSDHSLGALEAVGMEH